MTYFTYTYEMIILAYDVLWEVLNFPLNFLGQCDVWCLWVCKKPLRGQVHNFTSRGCFLDVKSSKQYVTYMVTTIVSNYKGRKRCILT